MNEQNRPSDLRAIAHKAMRDRGLEPDFPPDALRQLNGIPAAAHEPDPAIRDLRTLLWCSIDNDTSRDLDQLTVAEELDAGRVKILVAIADVDALVKPSSPIDRHARTNTTSVYTAAQIFPMLPERLSTDLTSLNENADRLALVIELVVNGDGSVQDSAVYRAVVTNHAKLAYRSVAAWLDGSGPVPEKIVKTAGLDEQLRLQDRIAHVMKSVRDAHGALDLETIEPEAVLRDGRVVDLRQERQNRAQDLIADFMIAANTASARFLEKRGLPALRRVVRTPERWDRIREVAAGFGEQLPAPPDSKALAAFLARRRQQDLLRFPDLSLTIVKLLGAGEYVVQLPGRESAGHFGLAVREYSHSTAPNRRFPDLVTQRLLKAALAGESLPYDAAELAALATHCTTQEDAAKKVERQVRKSAAALFLSGRIGEVFDALVTGAADKGTWVRVLTPPVEGRLTAGYQGVDVGDQIRVRLTGLNVERGFIDFARSGNDRTPGAPPRAASAVR
ncbi:RNB domain-containing ribonuclease [Frigoriglobus tundricola]|uniref:3'-to-5' exoribonuclease RNase R n=1 Tax=Frigoriglobus tundricola TaxID=2774151 RepID=A0A6M5YMS9_9BACT|nr:RNB domain-containing ribonuclease [Frigoriglobus tundricola]QJW94660.1 3'-to-5' exoribonuclease RNase R [Frigoriglobus tundricola]